ncbi:hypothetical protein Q3G72_020874 [Acer saccharum]|nr:hypothetical protein Q3G72_020874 [Acer saccharum]
MHVNAQLTFSNDNHQPLNNGDSGRNSSQLNELNLFPPQNNYLMTVFSYQQLCSRKHSKSGHACLLLMISIFPFLLVRKQSSIKPRRKSLDPRDLLASSPPWPTVGIPVLNREEDRESVSGVWVDKVMVNKDEGCHFK